MPNLSWAQDRASGAGEEETMKLSLPMRDAVFLLSALECAVRDRMAMADAWSNRGRWASEASAEARRYSQLSLEIRKQIDEQRRGKPCQR